jgi:fucose 4-O-acetylase-like acetyltransferase
VRTDAPVRPQRVAALALGVFAAAVALWGALISPTSSVAIDGLCLYGTRARSIVPFVLLMAVLSGCCAWIGVLVRAEDPVTSNAMIAIAVCILAIVATPYTINGTVNAVHVTFGTILFLLQLGVIARVVGWPVEPAVVPLLCAVAVGDLLAFGALTLDWPTMWVGQVLSQAGFLGVLVMWPAGVGTRPSRSAPTASE